MPSCIRPPKVPSDVSAATSAAPTMPALLPSCAIADLAAGIEAVEELVRVLRSRRRRARSGRTTAARAASSGRCRRASPSPSTTARASPVVAADAQLSAILPSTSMWPSSVFGTSTPSTNNAVPTPVPSVTIATTPFASRARSRSAPPRRPRRPRRSAPCTGRPSVCGRTARARRCRSTSWSMFAAVRTTPPRDDRRHRAADGPVVVEVRPTTSTIVPRDRVRCRRASAWRSVRGLPRSRWRDRRARALTPEPPTSTPMSVVNCTDRP